MRSQVYVIFSVDTEHDIISRYKTKTAGWSKGIPLLFEVFDASAMRGKVCWLLEYNLKDGILAANPRSEFFVKELPVKELPVKELPVKELPALITQIKNRGDELGLHPTMYDWLGGKRHIPVSSYNDPKLWNFTRSYHDPEFVMNLITSGVKEFRKVCGLNPIGCRTGTFHYAAHLSTALEKNRVHIDSSVSKELKRWETAPNAYYATRDNIRHKAPTKTGVLEIPTIGYICSGWSSFLLRLRTWCLLHRRQPIFLSFFIHNWQAITTDGSPNIRFLENLSSFLHLLRNHGACLLSWTEAREMYKDIYGTAKGRIGTNASG